MAQEIDKLNHHMSLLKQQYAKLQVKCQQIQSKFDVVVSVENDTLFSSRLTKIIRNLYNSSSFSDVKIKLNTREVCAHKIVLAARSDMWNDTFLADKTELDWAYLDTEIGDLLIFWLYTSELTLKSEEVVLKLIKVAHDFNLANLVECCEEFLIGIVSVGNCVKYYTLAEELQANNLKEYCSGLIQTYWDDLNSTDFEHMSGPLLYQMLKNKTEWPLHSAVRLQREDVVFLCLMEDSPKFAGAVNKWGGTNNDLPLEIALNHNNETIAMTLLQNNANINLIDGNGDSLLHRAIKQENSFSINFLLNNNCNINYLTKFENETPLHLLAKTKNLNLNYCQILKCLLMKNININAQTRLGFTALQIAIDSDNVDIFTVLMEEENLDLNIRNSDENSALYYALKKYEIGKDYYLKELLKMANLERDLVYSKSGDNLLQLLVKENQINSAIYLCDYIQDLNHINKMGESVLHLICMTNNAIMLLKKLLEMSANPNLLTNELKQSPLHYCIKFNCLNCIEVFIDFINNNDVINNNKPNFNLRDINGDTPLCLAINNCLNNFVPVLIKGSADVNIRNGKDLTLLHQAILKEDRKTALFLLDNGADVNAKTADSETPLQLAIHCRMAEVVDALCTRGVDMSEVDCLGNCPLWSALDSNQEDIASILVRYGCDTDCWSYGPDNCLQTLLHRAIDENKEEIAIFLIQAGCDLDSYRRPGPNGEGGDEAKDKATPLHLCCQWGLENVIRTLIEHGANVNNRDIDSKTPLHIAIENQHSEIITLLLSVPEIDLSLRDRTGLSPFATALTYRNNKAAQAILDKMPSAAEQFDCKGQNFLHIAIKKGDIESALFLLTVNVDVNSRVQDSMLTPPIHLAAKYGNETLIRSLILAGARVNDRDAQKQTALHVASEAGNTTAVLALLQNDIDFDALDAENNNALHIAVRDGHLNVVRTLLTESTINAEAVNLKGRNPLHELCKYGKENASAICDLFLECMPNYPINKTDINGNSPLLLAYMNGNGNLCRTLVKANACLGTENNERITIFNYQVPSKQLLNRLLDQLNQSAPWTNTDMCQECGKNFSITVRTHHCRHCGRALCNRCSDQEVPIIKFMENKPVRVCRICFDILKSGAF